MVDDSKPVVFLPVDKQANVMRNIARSSQHPCYARDNFVDILYHAILIDVGKIAANGEHTAWIPMSYIKDKLLATNPLMTVITLRAGFTIYKHLADYNDERIAWDK